MDKTRTARDAVACIKDGHTVMVGGFGSPGTPFTLLDALLEQGTRDLTIIKNEANEPGIGVSRLIEAGRVRKIILSHLGLNGVVIEMMNKGQIEVEFHPQGILAEKIRAGGAGLMAFVHDVGIHTILRDTRQVMDMDGRECFLEPALTADAALIRARTGDRFGNLTYEKSGRNFGALMAMAGKCVIAEVHELVEPGAMDPDQVHTPAAFVDQVVLLEQLGKDYEVLAHHVG